jgi:predicted ATPase
LALSTTLEGWAVAEQGRRHEGCELMRQGLQAWRDTGAKQTLPYQMALLAEAYGKSGLVNEGLHMVAEGLAIAHQNEEHCYLAELYRIQGELYLALPEADDTAAQASFDQALRIARTQQAKSLELRAAISLGQLLQRQGKPRQAHALLSDIYGWFSEGFETGDLQLAKRLLDALAVAGEPC